MEKMIAVCGLDCLSCPAYTAWKNDDNKLRVKTAEEWSKMYGFNFLPQMINCSGCLEEGEKVGHCMECEYRLCAIKKGLKNCAQCVDFPCKNLESFFAQVPYAKDNLEALK